MRLGVAHYPRRRALRPLEAGDASAGGDAQPLLGQRRREESRWKVHGPSVPGTVRDKPEVDPGRALGGVVGARS